LGDYHVSNDSVCISVMNNIVFLPQSPQQNHHIWGSSQRLDRRATTTKTGGTHTAPRTGLWICGRQWEACDCKV